MNEDQFTKLFNHMNDRFDEVNKKLDTKASQDSLDRLTNTIDGFVKRLDNTEIEQASRDLQFERLLEWAVMYLKKRGYHSKIFSNPKFTHIL